MTALAFCNHNKPVVFWDEIKRERNLREHGIDLAGLDCVFDAPMVTVEDGRETYGEQRREPISKSLMGRVAMERARMQGASRRAVPIVRPSGATQQAGPFHRNPQGPVFFAQPGVAPQSCMVDTSPSSRLGLRKKSSVAAHQGL